MKMRSFIFAAVLLILLAASSTGAFASEDTSDIVSNGRIVYANGTPADPSDDVIIYDSDDLKTLENRIKELEIHLAAAKSNLQ